jgi:hypothetical protein
MMNTKTPAAKIESLKKTLNSLSRIASDIQSEDYEALDALSRTIADAKADLHELDLALDGVASTEDDLLAA